MLSFLLTRYKSMQQQAVLQRPSRYKKLYAVAGTGTHTLTNIYPCLWHLGLPVKTVYSATLANAKAAAARWNNCTGTSDFNDILQDNSITGVILSVQPERQAGLVRQLLEHNKQVFVEKPLGYSLAELQSILEARKNNICQVGLQRRFSAVMTALRRQGKDVIGYNYRFLIGPYLEGNCVYDIFIHPIDFIIQAFGPARILHVSSSRPDVGMTCYITLAHAGGISGNIELSTQYSWQQPLDEITVNTTSKVITVRYPDHASALIKPRRIFTIPMEKIIPRPLRQEIYVQGSFVPSAALNSLQLMGFYPQLQHFADAVEKGSPSALSQPESLLPVYEILERLAPFAHRH